MLKSFLAHLPLIRTLQYSKFPVQILPVTLWRPCVCLLTFKVFWTLNRKERKETIFFSLNILDCLPKEAFCVEVLTHRDLQGMQLHLPRRSRKIFVYKLYGF